ncbi:hypothetical protein L3X38_002699 [Prunus dulcis]|uniref:Uncharacterized protein n=1 Tax=Prunus dulcis TaxID=3755 RepID=A0AAD4ZKY3_PRUDU|nr:hypothetical protein L3X38_002699 [Prunus dulcis]
MLFFLLDKPELCTLELHHFGLLENGVYKSGKVCFADYYVDDYLSLLDLKKIGAELGYKVDITQKVTSLKVFYRVHAKDVVKEVLDDRCIANLVATIPSNRRVVLYFHDPTDQNTLGSKKEVVWPSLDYEKYANMAEEEHVEVDSEVESEGNEADNEEENVEVEYEGNEADNEEENVEVESEDKEEDEELKDSDYEYTDDEMPNIDPRMTAKKRANVPPNVGEEEPTIDPQMVPPNEGIGAISDNGEGTDALPSEGKTSEDDQGSGENSKKSKKRKKRKLPNFKQFRRETDLRNPQFRLGMQFADREEVKKVIKEYKLIDRNQPTFGIKTLSLEHECTRVDSLGYCNARWLSIRFAYKIRKNPNWNVVAMQAEVREQYAMNVSKHQIWRAKRLSRVVIEGSYLEQYARLWDYAEKLKSSNKGSIVVIKNDMVGGEHVFQRIYVCLAGCKKGLLEGCKSVIGVDGCHLKGPHT